MILRNIFRMADSTPFTDIPLNVHWHGKDLYDDEYKVASVFQTLGRWEAIPHWDEQEQEFETEEEAKAWLVAMYKMGGCNEPRKRRRPAAK